MSDSDATEIDSQLGDLAAYGEIQEQKFIQELYEEEANQDIILETEQQQKIKDKYSKFLTQKVYGKGAFGEVIEQYDIFQRKRFAKKTFTRIEDYACEKNVLKKFDKLFEEEIPHILMRATRYDAKQKQIYYQSGNCNLHEFCEEKRKNRIYWWDNKEELNYIIVRIFELVKILYQKDVFHSDLKPVNLILEEQNAKHFTIKLIDLGGATYAYHYLTAITQAYFPNTNVFNATENKENRIYAEFYQLGRIIQEILLSSIYSYNDKIFQIDPRFATYKLFMQEYFFTSNLKRTNDLLKQYYDKEYTDIVEMCLDMKSKVVDIEKKVENLKKNQYKSIEDIYGLVQEIEQNKVSQFFSIENQGQKQIQKAEDFFTQDIIEELEFYKIFNQNRRGWDKCEDIYAKIVQFNLKQKGEIQNLQAIKDKLYDYQYDQKLVDFLPLLAFYESIFRKRISSKINKSFLQYRIENFMFSLDNTQNLIILQGILKHSSIPKDMDFELFNELYGKQPAYVQPSFSNEDELNNLISVFQFNKQKLTKYQSLILKKCTMFVDYQTKTQPKFMDELCKEFKQIIDDNSQNRELQLQCVNDIIDIRIWQMQIQSQFSFTQEYKELAINIEQQIRNLIDQYYPNQVVYEYGFVQTYLCKTLGYTLQFGDYAKNTQDYKKKLFQAESFVKSYMPEQVINPEGIYNQILLFINFLYQYYEISPEKLDIWNKSQMFNLAQAPNYSMYQGNFLKSLQEKNDKNIKKSLNERILKFVSQGQKFKLLQKQKNLVFIASQEINDIVDKLEDKTFYADFHYYFHKVQEGLQHQQIFTGDQEAFNINKQFLNIMEQEGKEYEFNDVNYQKVKYVTKQIATFFQLFFFIKRIYSLLGDKELLEKQLEILKQKFKNDQEIQNEIILYEKTVILQSQNEELIKSQILNKDIKIFKNPNKIHTNQWNNLKNTAEYCISNQFIQVKHNLKITHEKNWTLIRESYQLPPNPQLCKERNILYEKLIRNETDQPIEKNTQKQKIDNSEKNQKKIDKITQEEKIKNTEQQNVKTQTQQESIPEKNTETQIKEAKLDNQVQEIKKQDKKSDQEKRDSTVCCIIF